MPLPSVSTPFDYLVNQVIRDLDKAVETCREIRRSRHVGSDHKHTQLDALQRSLEEGPSFIRRENNTYSNLKGADDDGADDIGRTDFTGYVRQAEEINAHLEAIAYPPTHPHGSHHHHHLSRIFLPYWDPVYHKYKEDPHFHDLRVKWESIRDGIPQTFAEMSARLAKKEKDAKKKAEDEQKAKDDKKKLQDKLDVIQEEKNKKLAEDERRNTEQREEHEKTGRKRDKAVEDLVETKLGLEEDPITNMDKLANVMTHMQRAITPGPSHEDDPIRNMDKLAEVMGHVQRAITPGGGRRSQSTPQVIVIDPRHGPHPQIHISTYTTNDSDPDPDPFEIEEYINDTPRRRTRRYSHPRAHVMHSAGGRSSAPLLIEPATRHGQRGSWVSAPPRALAEVWRGE